MKVSISWLKEYISAGLDAETVAEALTMTGLEVDSIEDRHSWLETVVAGKISRVWNHPRADHLKVCEVDIGEEETVSIVCGAPNVEEGMMSPTARPGTRMPDGKKIEKTVIRNVTSEGMICSEAELDIGPDKSGVMELDPAITPGTPVTDALNLKDPVLDIDLTPNRSDCWSVIGVAREIAAILKTDLKYPELDFLDAGDEIRNVTSVSIENPVDCPRYAARVFKDVKVGPSPFWLQERLKSIGVRPINNIVDTTNFVMLEMGQPIHAFDFDLLEENRIVVRNAEENERFFTLDDKERILSSDMLMICDGKKPVAVGGVMGGQNTEINDATKNVLIECAYFNPVSIRKTSKKLGLSTDASNRYERGVDPCITIPAINRVCSILSEISGGKPVPGLIDERFEAHTPQPARLTVSMDRINRLLGIQLDSDTVKSLLESIEFEVEKSADPDQLIVKAPSFRVDIKRPVDIAEEAARLWGYDHIPETLPQMPVYAEAPKQMIRFRDRVKELMTGFGLTETVNYCFVHESSSDRVRIPENDPRRKHVKVLNPLTEDQAVMRTTLIPGLLETVRRNFSQQNRNLKLFETGKIFIDQGKDVLPDETEMLAGIWTGLRYPSSWVHDDIECDFYDIKGVVEAFLEAVKLKTAEFTQIPADAHDYTLPGRGARITIESGGRKTQIGVIGELHPFTAGQYDLKKPVYVFEIDLDLLASMIPGAPIYQPASKYPAIDRDITLILDKPTETGTVQSYIENLDESLVEAVTLITVYAGEKLPENKKSVTFRLTYRSFHGTLEDETITALNKSITDNLIDQFDAQLP